MDARFMQIHNFVLTREIIINSIFPVDRMRELNFHRETAVSCSLGCHATLPETTTFFYINAFSGSKRWNFLRLFSDYKWT